MSAFDALHPALQHHIVNSLGWRELRPFQELVIPHLRAGKHTVMLAPTAGGKTEAAIFPLLSNMIEHDWKPTSVLYLCPIKALLNNLEQRLGGYAQLLGRHCQAWHGDVTQAARRQLLKTPPDILLTTPESLEVMLVSTRVDEQVLFENIQAVVIDEVHSFAGDDRGWHLLAVLSRIEHLTRFEFQRIGLSATVGNPEELMDWLAGTSCDRPEHLHLPADDVMRQSSVQVDYVGSLANAATVVARMHRGEKRLAFVDSRTQAELLTRHLREHEVRCWVVHSSLSVDQRRQAEQAFAEETDCVIVATSALELGVDIGDLAIYKQHCANQGKVWWVEERYAAGCRTCQQVPTSPPTIGIANWELFEIVAYGSGILHAPTPRKEPEFSELISSHGLGRLSVAFHWALASLVKFPSEVMVPVRQDFLHWGQMGHASPTRVTV